MKDCFFNQKTTKLNYRTSLFDSFKEELKKKNEIYFAFTKEDLSKLHKVEKLTQRVINYNKERDLLIKKISYAKGDPKQIEAWIELAQYCKRNNDINSFCEIMSGLEAFPKEDISSLKPQYKKLCKYYLKLASPEGNFENIKAYMRAKEKETKLPCIPPFFVLIRNLTFSLEALEQEGWNVDNSVDFILKISFSHPSTTLSMLYEKCTDEPKNYIETKLGYDPENSGETGQKSVKEFLKDVVGFWKISMENEEKMEKKLGEDFEKILFALSYYSETKDVEDTSEKQNGLKRLTH